MGLYSVKFIQIVQWLKNFLRAFTFSAKKVFYLKLNMLKNNNKSHGFGI